MLILHGSFLPEKNNEAAQFVIWGESRGELPPMEVRKGVRGASTPDFAARDRGSTPVTSTLRRRNSAPLTPAHPFAATGERLVDAISGWWTGVKPAGISLLAHLPTVKNKPVPSPQSMMGAEARDARRVLRSWVVPAVALSPAESLRFLVRMPVQDWPGAAVAAGSDLVFWRAVARLVLELLASGRFKPELIGTNGSVYAIWRPLLESSADRDRYYELSSRMPAAARAITRGPRERFQGAAALLEEFVKSAVDGFARRSAFGRSTRGPMRPRSGQSQEEAEHAGSVRSQEAIPGRSLLAALAAEDATLETTSEFVEQFREWSRPPDSYRGGNARICFRLKIPPNQGPGSRQVGEAAVRSWSLEYLLQAEDDPSLLVPARTVWQERGSYLKFLSRKFEHPQERLLAGLGAAERVFPPIGASLREAKPEQSSLTSGEAYSFIKEASVLLTSNGFGVLLPGISRKIRAKLKLSPRKQGKSQAGAKRGLSLRRLVDFDWEVAIGGQRLTRAEFEKLVKLKMPLVQVRGEWVELNPDDLQRALDFWERMESGTGIGLGQALEMALGAEATPGMPVSEIEASGWVGDVLKKLSGESSIQQLEAPAEFQGKLRHYQKSGFSWLAFLREFGLGGCLADDMGLGKTIQAIALLLDLRSKGNKRPALLICPTSVMGNWHRELGRFAPSLRVLVHHGTKREKADFSKLATRHEVVISSYSLLHRDEKELTEVEWGELILDEAQNIKNPDTRQAGAARKIAAEHRIALTGTPIENRLSELWSIFEFLNSGYLGARKSFRSAFELPIERTADKEAARRLKSLTGPFILRRLKTDKSVIRDLPEKNEMKVFCTLTREQATLYEAVVRDSMKAISEAEGIKRRGVVLATLMKLKQVCNHPAQFLGDGSSLEDRSGKLNRLAEMLEEARSVGDRSLIFTQFAEMGELLMQYLERTFGQEVLFLHGGTPVRARQAMVDRFQSDEGGPFAFVLSLKAGGTGLNLTRASHVFHYDRWWNPAVENQATDRAFRIGQARNVQVHKYICGGTVEEQIDAMIEAKKELADNIVGTGEGWITELGTEQLRELFRLRKEAID